MKKKGFTLAEVLITLTIIGVIAAITMPSLNSSSQNQQLGVRLASTVSLIENAMTSMIAQEDVRNLYQTNAWRIAQEAGDELKSNSPYEKKAAFVGNLKQYLGITDFYTDTYDNYYGGKIKAISGAVDWRGLKEGEAGVDSEGKNVKGSGASIKSECIPIELKNGATIFMHVFSKGYTNSTPQDIINAGGSLFSEAADLFVDVNGRKGPNTIGRDLFTFYLGSDGIMYAAGGRDVAALEGNGKSIWSNTDSIWACTDTVVKNHGWGCAGRVVAEGYKITY